MKNKIQRIGLKSYPNYDRFIKGKIYILFTCLNISGFFFFLNVKIFITIIRKIICRIFMFQNQSFNDMDCCLKRFLRIKQLIKG